MPIRSYHPSRYQEPPEWAKELQRGVFLLTQRVDSLGPKIDSIKVTQQQAMSPIDERKYYTREQTPSEMYTQTPLTQTVNIQTHPTGTVGDESMFQPATDIHIVESTHGQTLPGSMHHHDGSTHGLTEQEEYEDDETEHGHGRYAQASTQGDTHNRGLSEYTGNRDSPGQQRNCTSSASERALEASLGILTRRGNWLGITVITKRKTRTGKPQLPSRACKRSQTPTLVAMETVGPPHLHSHPHLLTMVLGMCLQVRSGRSNPRATTIASRRSCIRGSASTNAYLIGLSSGLSPSSTPRSRARHAETRLTRSHSVSGQRKLTSDTYAAR